MRLTCPKCGAEYEVPEELVPEGGKHVQCTDCDTRWFVRGGRDAVVSEDQLIERLENWRPRLVTGGPHPKARPAEPEASEPAAPATPPRAEPRPVGPEPEPEPTREIEPELVREPASEREPAPDPPPPQRDVSADGDWDPDRDVMTDLDQVEPPEDFVWEDSDGAVRPPDPAPAASAPARPTPAPAPPAAAPVFRPVSPPEPASAPDRAEAPVVAEKSEPAAEAPSPVVSETAAEDEDARPVRERTRNSHRIELPEDGARSAGFPPSHRETTGRFRTGLLVALALFALALGVYAGREAIVGTVPAAAPALEGYASAVDGLRERIDAVIAPDG